MKQRGRQSQEAQTTLTAIIDRRPEPPEGLNDFQQAVWRRVVATRPSDWFRPDTRDLLVSYCRHVWHAARIDELLEARFETDEPQKRGEIPEMLKARERESRVMLALARSMRITQQSQYDPKTAKRRKEPLGTPPWETYDD
jgi:phage terminase small subunit